jgi:YspA, cpYpsA-related SLOG family
MTNASGESLYAASGLRVVYPENPIRILVTGWRAWPSADRKIIWDELDGLWTQFDIPWERDRFIIVHGHCPYGGVDLFAEEWAIVQRQRWERHPADWGKFGKAAGPRRNAEMVALGAELCIGFPGPDSKGTKDCLNKAAAAGIKTHSVAWVAAMKPPG